MGDKERERSWKSNWRRWDRASGFPTATRHWEIDCRDGWDCVRVGASSILIRYKNGFPPEQTGKLYHLSRFSG